MKMKFLSSAWMMLMLFSVCTAHAQTAPETLVKTVIEDLIDEFTVARESLAQDHGKLYALVDNKVAPHFDFDKISKLVIGKYWKRITDAQRQQFQKEFHQMLLRTYAAALFEYTGKEEMTFKSTIYNEDKTRATVKSEIRLPEGEPIPVDYTMFINGANQWKVVNIKIAGISLAHNFRQSYTQIIKNKGMDALIQSLMEKNVQAQAKAS